MVSIKVNLLRKWNKLFAGHKYLRRVAGGPFKPDFGLSGAFRPQERELING